MVYAAYFVAHQVPFFLLTFGILMVVLAFAFRPLGAALLLPPAILSIIVSVTWFAVSGGSINNMPWDVSEVIGVGIVLIVVARIFGE